LILERLERARQAEDRTRLADAEDIAGTLSRYLQDCPGVKQVAIAGSYRRRRETVGDLDILVTAKQGTAVTDHFIDYDEVSEVVSQGRTRSTVRLRSGMQVDLRVVPRVSYGAALLYFTGSRAHNIALRKLAIKQGYKLNEYGLYKGDKRIAGATETAVYKKLNLPYIEPELREQRGEIEAARKGRLPKLVSRDDIRGDLHCHTRATDGHDSLETMVTAARKLGYEYFAITDHSRRLTVAHGLDRKRLLEQTRRIDKLNAKLNDIVVLKSIEVDILEDGGLDLPDSVLGQLDLVVGAVHYKFNLSRKQQTERIIRAMDNPHFNILAHPSGRLLNKRPPLDVDMGRLMQAARERGCFLELNAQPARLDLTDSDCMLARELHLKVVISTDAHSTGNLDYMHFGISQARRGWLGPADVVNTSGLDELRKLLRRN
jgi:DNA polymerase (family 10)